MLSWPFVALIVFEVLQSVGCYRSQYSFKFSSRLLAASNSGKEKHAAWDTKYMTRSILLENALAREKNSRHELHRQVIVLKGDREYFQSQLESANVQTVFLESELANSRQRERKFKARSILLEEVTRNLRYENEELRHKLELASSSSYFSSSSFTSISPSVPSGEMSIISPPLPIIMDSHQCTEEKKSSLPRSENCGTVLDPTMMESFDNYSSDMNVQLRRALSALSSSVKELLSLFLMKCVRTVDALNGLFESNRGSLTLSYSRLMKYLMKFLHRRFPTRNPSPTSSSSSQSHHLLPIHNNHNSWDINYSVESSNTKY